MTTRLYAIIFLVAEQLAFARFAMPQDLKFSMSTISGVLYGTSREYVFDYGYTISELDWGIQPLFYAGAAVQFSMPVGFVASVVFKAGVPTYAGIVTDSDFLNYDEVKTHYSQSDSYVERAILVDSRIGWIFPLSSGLEPLTIALYGEFDLMLFEWSARNGFLQYPPESTYPYSPWSASEPQIPSVGTLSSYEQNYFIPAFSFDMVIPLGSGFYTSLSFSLSPILWCFDVDKHFLRGIEFYDDMSGGWFLNPLFLLEYRTAYFCISTEFSYRYIQGLVGGSYYVMTGAGISTNQSSVTPNGGGAAFDAFEMKLSLTVPLGGK